MSPRDHQARTSEIGEPDPIPESTKDRARRVVAGSALDAQDCEHLWMMLGIHPRQDKDIEPDTSVMQPSSFNTTAPRRA